MIKEIIKGISMALAAEFAEENCTIYAEEVRQELKKPAFFVFALNPSGGLFRGKRYLYRNPFVIQYFPAGEAQEECMDVAERMMRCLEFLTLPGEDMPILGMKMRYEVPDGILNFFVNYDLFMIEKEQEDMMEELEQTGTVKQEEPDQRAGGVLGKDR